MQISKPGCFTYLFIEKLRLYRLGGWQIMGACHKVTLLKSAAASLKGTNLNYRQSTVVVLLHISILDTILVLSITTHSPKVISTGSTRSIDRLAS